MFILFSLSLVRLQYLTLGKKYLLKRFVWKVLHCATRINGERGRSARDLSESEEHRLHAD